MSPAPLDPGLYMMQRSYPRIFVSPCFVKVEGCQGWNESWLACWRPVVNVIQILFSLSLTKQQNGLECLSLVIFEFYLALANKGESLPWAPNNAPLYELVQGLNG